MTGGLIHPESKGAGLQYHQLETLAAVHRDGGLAYVLWRNGGMVGRLSGDKIAAAFFEYTVSLKMEDEGQVVKKGVRSIP